jgi:hypothetical protein
MKIRILRDINGPGGVDWPKGSEQTCGPALARELLGINAAELIDALPETNGVTIETSDPIVLQSDPAVSRRGRR